MAARVFWSYARSDREFAHRCANLLEAEGTSVFLPDRDIAPGEEWQERTRDALRSADAVIVVLSEAALRSNLVLMELGAAWATDKPIIPIIPPNENIPDRIPVPLDGVAMLRTSSLSDAAIATTLRESLAA